MRREEKSDIINSLAGTLKEYSHFYLTDTAQLNAADTSALRRKCFENQIKLVVVKNTLLKRAMEQANLDCGELFPALKGTTAVMFSNSGNAPAKLIKEFRKSHPKPLVKGAFIEECVYTASDNLIDVLVALKTREELIGEVIGLLQSPAQNVVSALQSGGTKIHGVLETLSNK